MTVQRIVVVESVNQTEALYNVGQNYKDQGSAMELASIITITILVTWVLMAVLDVWFDIMPWTVFIKLTITLGLLALVVLVIAIAKKKYIDEQTLKKDKFID